MWTRKISLSYLVVSVPTRMLVRNDYIFFLSFFFYSRPLAAFGFFFLLLVRHKVPRILQPERILIVIEGRRISARNDTWFIFKMAFQQRFCGATMLNNTFTRTVATTTGSFHTTSIIMIKEYIVLWYAFTGFL